MSTKKTPITITALKVHQWVPTWDNMSFDPKEWQAPPPKHFFVFAMKASDLKALTGVYRRSTKGSKPRAKDPNVQRGHEEERSSKIREFVKYGYPWCEMGEAKRKAPDADDLKKPGWLPTAIVVNILPPKSVRNDVEIPTGDLIHLEDSGSTAVLHLPESFKDAQWEPQQVFPLEVIDGQHRLWAFESFDPAGDFEVPVVAFYGLDHGWQAYLFWSINITPKKIDRSLGYDLYPLLRQQTWLDRLAGHSIYRETRCQEIVEAIWAHPDSPWRQRINMLGETKQHREYKGPTVSQAAWIRSLMASFVKQSEGKGTKIGGLFGAARGTHELSLPWNRSMQAAFLIFAGNALRESVAATKSSWARQLRQLDAKGLFSGDDPAFYGEHSLLTTDQGIRGFLFTVNDLCYVVANELDLAEWRWADAKVKKVADIEQDAVLAALTSLSQTKVAKFLKDIAAGLSSYDWRTSSTPGLEEAERLRQSVFRGSGGYKEIRRQLLTHLEGQGGSVAQAAQTVIRSLRYQ